MKQKDRQPFVILVGGGTGGHITPLIAIAEELETRRVPFLYVGGKTGREKEMIMAAKWPFQEIEAGKWRRYFSLPSLVFNLIDCFRVIVGFFQSLAILYRTGATVVISKGGYVALPMVFASYFSPAKLIIHESDSVMGLTNRLASRFADKVLTAFDPAVFPNRDERFCQVGVPIRRSLRQASSLKAPTKSRPLVLIMPGIQGSQAINAYVKVVLKKLLERFDIVHATGEKDAPIFQALHHDLKPAEKPHYKPYSFIDRELPYYFQGADLIVGRASVTTIAESATFGKAMYLIPLPTSAANHQVMNARKLVQAGVVFAREQYQLNPEVFLQDIEKLLADSEKLHQLGEGLKRYFNEAEALPSIMKEVGIQ